MGFIRALDRTIIPLDASRKKYINPRPFPPPPPPPPSCREGPLLHVVSRYLIVAALVRARVKKLPDDEIRTITCRLTQKMCTPDDTDVFRFRREFYTQREWHENTMYERASRRIASR